MTPREQIIDQLAPLMRHELDRNAWKGDDWQRTPAGDLVFEIVYHAAKLDLAIRQNDRPAMAELCADVANCAAIAADSLGVADVALLPEVTDEFTYDADNKDGGMRYGGRELKQMVGAWLSDLYKYAQDAATVA